MTDSTWNFPDNKPTHGGPRPNSGRRHLDGTPPGEDAADPAERHTVTMPASMWEVVKDAGGGTYSIGLRIIVNEWQPKTKTIIQFLLPWEEEGVLSFDPFINGIWGEVVGHELEELEKWLPEYQDDFPRDDGDVLTIQGELTRENYTGHKVELVLENLRVVKKENWNNCSSDPLEKAILDEDADIPF